MKPQFWPLLAEFKRWTPRFWRARVMAFVMALIAAVVLVPLLPTASNATEAADVQFVSPDWVKEHSADSDLRVLDVRLNPFDYFVSHIPNAVHIADNTFCGPNGALPVQYWQPEKLQSFFSQAGVNDTSQVLIYSDGRDVLGATMVAYLLERSGHSNVAVLDGGFAGYKAANLPVTKEFPRYPRGTFTVRDDASVRVTLAQVRDLIGKRGVTFIDPRPADVFAGQQDIWVRNGHIPGAKNIPWRLAGGGVGDRPFPWHRPAWLVLPLRACRPNAATVEL